MDSTINIIWVTMNQVLMRRSGFYHKSMFSLFRYFDEDTSSIERAKRNKKRANTIEIKEREK